MTYINFGKILELVLNNGVDPATGIQLISINGRKDRSITFSSYDEVWQAWKKTFEVLHRPRRTERQNMRHQS